MTKWARMRRRKERRRAESEARRANEPQIEEPRVQPEEITENIQPTRESKEQEPQTQTSNQHPILSQIPGYVYLVAFFALLAGIFFPLITDNPAEQNLDNFLKGFGILFLGLAGTILVFKATTSDKKRGVFLGIGFALVAISIALIFTIAGTPGT